MKEDKAITQEREAEVQGWKEQTMKFYKAHTYSFNPLQTWRRSGLEALVEEAKSFFQEMTGVILPYNLGMDAPYNGRNRYRNHRDMEVAEEVFRFCGWLKAAVDFPILVMMIDRATSVAGVNSPYTYIDLWEVAKKSPSPGRLAHRLHKVRQRTNLILEPYGLGAAWAALAKVVGRSPKGRVGQLAIRTAGETIRQFLEGTSWRNRIGLFECSAREILMKSRGLRDLVGDIGKLRLAFNILEDGRAESLRQAETFIVADETAGVFLWLDTGYYEIFHGIGIQKGIDRDGGYQFLAKQGERNFHTFEEFASYRNKERWLVRAAIRKWKKQMEAEKAEADFFHKVFPRDRTILVYRQDSYDAGNCVPGTESFLKRHGWAERLFIPMMFLKDHLSDPYVNKMLRRFATQL